MATLMGKTFARRKFTRYFMLFWRKLLHRFNSKGLLWRKKTWHEHIDTKLRKLSRSFWNLCTWATWGLKELEIFETLAGHFRCWKYLRHHLDTYRSFKKGHMEVMKHLGPWRAFKATGHLQHLGTWRAL